MYRGAASQKGKRNFVMTLPESKFICSAAVEEVHIFLGGKLPGCGEIISVPSLCTDSGSCVFTVNTCGVSEFILHTTTCNINNIILSINALQTPCLYAFAETHLSVRTSLRVQKQKRFTRSSGLFCTKVKLQKRAVLRL